MEHGFFILDGVVSSAGNSGVFDLLISNGMVVGEDVLGSNGEDTRVCGEVPFAFLGSDAELGDKGGKLGNIAIPDFIEGAEMVSYAINPDREERSKGLLD